MESKTKALLNNTFELDVQDELSEEQVIDMLADRILQMLERNAEALFSILYTMDIAEEKVAAALHPSAVLPSNVSLAHLVLEREKERIRTREKYRDPDGGGGFGW